MPSQAPDPFFDDEAQAPEQAPEHFVDRESAGQPEPIEVGSYEPASAPEPWQAEDRAGAEQPEPIDFGEREPVEQPEPIDAGTYEPAAPPETTDVQPYEGAHAPDPWQVEDRQPVQQPEAPEINRDINLSVEPIMEVERRGELPDVSAVEVERSLPDLNPPATEWIDRNPRDPNSVDASRMRRMDRATTRETFWAS